MFEKIIWLVPSRNNSLESSYIDLLNRNGIAVEQYCYNDKFLDLGYKKLLFEIKDICSDYDLVIVTLWADSHMISPKLLNELRLKSYIALFCVDDEIYSTSMSIYYASSIDLVVTTDYFGRGIFDQIGVPTIYFPFPRLDLGPPSLPNHKIFDISFIGNTYTADRQNYLQSLEKAGLEVNIYGKGSKNGFLTEQEYISVIRSSRINLNFTKVLLSSKIKFNEPWRAGMRQFKGRPFEVSLLGSFCLSEWAPNASHLFNETSQIPVFRNSSELISQVRYFLNNHEERESMALSAHKHFLSNYAAPKSLIKLFNSIEHILLNCKKNNLEESFSPSIYYLQNVNSSSLNLFKLNLKHKKFFRAFSVLFSMLRFKALIFSALSLPYRIISKIFKL